MTNHKLHNIHLDDCVKRLQQITDQQSFYTKSGKKPIRITFTRFRSERIEKNHLAFRLDARCSTYQGIGILYLHVKGNFEGTHSEIRTHYQIGLGLPTSLFELALGVIWNLLVLLTGIILIVSASELASVEKAVRYGFLPLIYGIYGVRLATMYLRVANSIPEIVSSWCDI